jgi:hypothetical protein
MKLFRIEHGETGNGMWTEKINNKLVLDFLSDDRLSKLPMPDDNVFRTNYKEWKTSVKSIKALYDWFSKDDMIEMFKYGFRLIEIESTDIIIQPHQVLFMPETVIKCIDITNIGVIK